MTFKHNWSWLYWSIRTPLWWFSCMNLMILCYTCSAHQHCICSSTASYVAMLSALLNQDFAIGQSHGSLLVTCKNLQFSEFCWYCFIWAAEQYPKHVVSIPNLCQWLTFYKLFLAMLNRMILKRSFYILTRYHLTCLNLSETKKN